MQVAFWLDIFKIWLDMFSDKKITTVVCRTVVMHQAELGSDSEVPMFVLTLYCSQAIKPLPISASRQS